MNQNIRASTAVATRVSCSIPFDIDGKHQGFLSVPYSSHESAYGRVQIPIVCIRNGDGPTVLLVAGNHGDEYEGQVALSELAQTLKPTDIYGRVLIVPVLNAPAAEVARRVSPIDGGNLNRAFPGDPGGSPTEMIAHYVESVLLPLADYSVDLHSGGSSLYYLPCTLIRDTGTSELLERQFSAMRAFGGKIAYITSGENQGAERTFAAAASRNGVVCITTELGGGAAIDAEGAMLARDGISRLLGHVDILKSGNGAGADEPCLMTVEGSGSYVLAPDSGVFEHAFKLGDTVAPGDLAGRIWFPSSPWREPEKLFFQNGGYVICQRAVAWVKRGDCLAQVLAPYKKGIPGHELLTA